MKKTMSLILGVSMSTILGVSTAFAGTPGFGAGAEFTPRNFEAVDGSTTQVPVYGYVGPDVEITDPRPDDEDAGLSQIDVSVPTKIIWAAFESDNKQVTSPVYKIINNSNKNDVKITMKSIAPKNSMQEQEKLVDSYLNLKLIDSVKSTEIIESVTEGVSANYNIGNGQELDTLETVTAGSNEWVFNIGGNLESAFAWPDVAMLPTYTLEFQFDIANSTPPIN
ncbi:MAG: hypothetical protein LBU32_16340 [Clostridiales bacterium]|jgi:hypothetical protein|nr:hypothetical protein [Clostridiales bacterium]